MRKRYPFHEISKAACTFLFGFGLCAVSSATDYYVDASGGNDSLNGRSEANAWQTLSRAGSQSYSAGDRILLKRGETFTGRLNLSGEKGAAGSPIIVSDYGTSPDRAVIDGTGQNESIYVGGCEYIEIENLEITGRGINGAAWWWQAPSTFFDHYHFRNLHIHDTSNSGINLIVSNLGGYTYRGITVSDCVLENIGGSGITVNKWAGEAVKTVDNIGPADPARAPGTYTNVQADNLTRSQIIPAEFTVTVNASGAASIEVTYKGAGYKETDSLVIADADLGGGGAADLTFQVNKVQPADPNGFYHEDLVIRSNRISNVDGPGMQFGKIRNGLLEGNIVTDPGRNYDAAGSGLWTWYCGTPSTTFIAQHNTFTGSQGDTDSCGAHIDIGCVNTIYQYNLSVENQGGFMEILGKAYNCVYRYNISINDGIREAATNPYQADGRTLFLGGYTGRNGPQLGPYNSYIYNNTIYTRPEIVSKYSIAASAAGALFANNIIYVSGSAVDVQPPGSGTGNGTDIIFENNLVFENKVPITPWNTYSNNWAADPQYLNRGGLATEDYKAINFNQIVNQGINLYTVPEDVDGVAGGFAVKEDILGNPIVGLPDMGAIEMESEYAALLAWMDAHSIPRDADLMSDLNGDGVSLLAAYSQHLDPNEDLSGSFPVFGYNSTNDTLNMIYYAIADNIAYKVHETTSLSSNWGAFVSGTMSGPDGDGNVTAVVPLTNGVDQLFLRLSTTLQ
jgi:hypothetical protein